ncbi:hypothetical protein AHAS_Ahas09G0206700 [Arachis hypogaea]
MLFLFFSHLGHKNYINEVLFFIDSDGIIKQAKLSVRKALEQPFNGRKIILRFNRKLQPIRDGADLLNGILGMLGAYYNKFFICEKN